MFHAYTLFPISYMPAYNRKKFFVIFQILITVMNGGFEEVKSLINIFRIKFSS